MKKIIPIILLIALTTSVKSQSLMPDHRNEIAASYGVLTTNQFYNILKDVITAIFSFGNYDKENGNYTGGYYLTYKFNPTENLSIGITGGIDKANGDLVEDDIKYGEYESSYTSAIIGFDYRYLNREMIQLYSGAGAGITFGKDTGTLLDSGETGSSNQQSYLNFQLNLLGIRVGKSLAGFAEFGFGYKGMVNAGISWQF